MTVIDKLLWKKNTKKSNCMDEDKKLQLKVHRQQLMFNNENLRSSKMFGLKAKFISIIRANHNYIYLHIIEIFVVWVVVHLRIYKRFNSHNLFLTCVHKSTSSTVTRNRGCILKKKWILLSFSCFDEAIKTFPSWNYDVICKKGSYFRSKGLSKYTLHLG